MTVKKVKGGYATKKCKDCGLELALNRFEKNDRGYWGRRQCKRCRSIYNIKFRKDRTRKRKIELIKYKGGKCEICNYDKCNAALEFHHIEDKKFSIGLTISRLSEEDYQNIIFGEIDKCLLLCANCHREIHFEGGIL